MCVFPKGDPKIYNTEKMVQQFFPGLAETIIAVGGTTSINYKVTFFTASLKASLNLFIFLVRTTIIMNMENSPVTKLTH